MDDKYSKLPRSLYMSLLVQNNLISPPNRFSICDKISLKFIGYIDCDRKIPRHSWKSDYEVYAPFQTKILERYIHWKSTVWMNEPFTPEKDRCVWQGAFLSRLSPWHKFFNALTILLLGFLRSVWSHSRGSLVTYKRRPYWHTQLKTEWELRREYPFETWMSISDPCFLITLTSQV